MCKCGKDAVDGLGRCWDCRHAALMAVQFESLLRAQNGKRPSVREDARREIEISTLKIWMSLPAAEWGR